MFALTPGLNFRESSSLLPPIPFPPDNHEKETESAYAAPLLKLPREEICKGNIPPQLLKAWCNDVFSGIKKGIFPPVIVTAYHWLVDNAFRHLFTDDTFLISGTQVLTDRDFWDSADPKLRVSMLFRLYQIDKGLYIPENHPAKLALYKFMDSIIIALGKNVQDKAHFSVPMPGGNHKFLFCFNTPEGWRCGDFDASTKQPFRVVQVNINKTQTLLIDEKEDIVKHPGIIISARIRPDSDYFMLSATDLDYYKNMIIKVDFLIYNGSPDVSGSQRNSLAFTADIDLHDKLPTLKGLRQENALAVIEKDRLTMKQQRSCFEKIDEFFPIFSQRIVQEAKAARGAPIAIPIFQPQSQSDKLQIIYRLLLDLCQNPDVHVAEISYIAEQLNPTFSEEEIRSMVQEGNAKEAEEGTIEVTPKAILAKLCSDTKEKLAQSLQAAPAIAEKMKEEVSLESESKGKEVSSKKEAGQGIRVLRDEAEKARRRELYQWEQYKLQKKAAASQTAEENSQPSFELSSDEQARVDSIYKGHPLKAKEFTTFAIGLLRKKATDLEAEPTARRKGSHVKFHLKREDGGPSSGVTFVIQHKKKDHRGSLQAQKDTLDHIFSL